MWQFDRQAYEKRMAWFTQARFGMFLHWGLYSIPARGEWIRSTEEMPEEEYMKYFDEFNPVDYDPRKWARMAKEAGMKYVVMTAKHHDGFCLFDSQYTDFKATNTKAGRDLIREYVDAVRAEGLKVGLYYSLLDWHHPDFPQYGDRNAPMRNHPECGNENRHFERYVEYFHNQVRELCTNYGKIDLLWFDFSYDDMRGEKWGATKLIEMVRSLQPDVIIDNRLEVSGEGRPEGIRDVQGNPMAWESCFTMNRNWGYCGTDHLFKPGSLLIRKLVECVSKGGNMILNVGPDARGNFPKESVQILQEFAAWMKKNGESIYGCTFSELPKPEYGRITQRGKNLYFHIYENTIGPLPLVGVKPDEVKAIRAVDTGYEIPVSHSWVHSDYPDTCFADLGPDPVLPDPVDYVIRVELK